ncbi:MAG: sulfur carrier protein ThiS [Deltaproteobacteria bacterium]|nr:sulfur carrier protein ThiS [Deltaproteobacteria bacterium]
MIRICLNGEEKFLPGVLQLSELLKQVNLSTQSIAVAINHEVVPRSDYTERQLRNDDEIEIIRAVGGG